MEIHPSADDYQMRQRGYAIVIFLRGSDKPIGGKKRLK